MSLGCRSFKQAIPNLPVTAQGGTLKSCYQLCQVLRSAHASKTQVFIGQDLHDF